MSTKPTPQQVEEFFEGLGDTDTPSQVDNPEVIQPAEDAAQDQQEDPKQEDPEEPEEAPIFTREPKKKKAPDESFNEIRKARDEAIKEASQFKQLFEGFDKPDVVKPIVEFIKDIANGPVTEDVIVSFLDEVKNKDQEIIELKSKLEEQEKTVNELDVRYSSEFKEHYEKPYRQAAEDLFLEFANVTDDKKVIGPKSTKKFNDFLLNINDIDGRSVKSALQAFAKEYREETGEEAVLPTINSLMSSLRSFHSNKEKLNEAVSNWKIKKQETQRQYEIRMEQEREALERKSKRERTTLASKAYSEFDFDSIDFIEEDEVKGIFNKEFQAYENILKGEAVPPYNELLTRGVKANLFDKLIPRLKELMEKESKQKKDERSGLPGGGGTAHHRNKVEDDWLKI